MNLSELAVFEQSWDQPELVLGALHVIQGFHQDLHVNSIWHPGWQPADQFKSTRNVRLCYTNSDIFIINDGKNHLEVALEEKG